MEMETNSEYMARLKKEATEFAKTQSPMPAAPTKTELDAMRKRDAKTTSAMDALQNEGCDQSEPADNTPSHKADY